MFLGMCNEVNVWDKLEAGKILPTRARVFAEGLILDLDVSATKARIKSDPAGAAAVTEVVQALIHDRKTRPHLAAGMPRGKMTPFYVMSSLILDTSQEELETFEKMLDTSYSDNQL